MEAQWLADRTTLRTLLRTHPEWSVRDFAEAIGRSRGWVKKWRRRLRAAPPDDDAVLHSRSRARNHPPPPLDPRVIDRILEIRDQPPGNLQRTPGPKTILYYLARDPDLAGARPAPARARRAPSGRSSASTAASPSPASVATRPVERPAPMTAWQLDFKDVSTRACRPRGQAATCGRSPQYRRCRHLDPRQCPTTR